MRMENVRSKNEFYRKNRCDFVSVLVELPILYDTLQQCGCDTCGSPVMVLRETVSTQGVVFRVKLKCKKGHIINWSSSSLCSDNVSEYTLNRVETFALAASHLEMCLNFEIIQFFVGDPVIIKNGLFDNRYISAKIYQYMYGDFVFFHGEGDARYDSKGFSTLTCSAFFLCSNSYDNPVLYVHHQKKARTSTPPHLISHSAEDIKRGQIFGGPSTELV